jgi:peptide/nickel transport system permease protein
MKPGKLLSNNIFTRNIPGYWHYREGHRVYGVLLFLGFSFFPLIIAFNFQKVLAGIFSFFLSLTMLGLEPALKTRIMRPELVEHWVAALFAISAPILIWSLDRKYVKRKFRPANEDEYSQTDISWNAFIKHKSSVIGIIIISFMYSIAFLCPYIAPEDPNSFQDGLVTQFKAPLSSSTVLYFKHDASYLQDTDAGRYSDYPDMYTTLVKINGTISYYWKADLRYVDAYRIEEDQVIATVGHESEVFRIASLIDPDPEVFAGTQVHIFGTDSYGRDLLSRIIYGSRISLSLGFIAVLLSVVLGTVIGLFAGYFGGKTDSITMRLVDILLAFPSLFLILIFIAVFEKAEVPRIVLIVVILGLTTWMGVARLVRGEVLSLKERDFILAAKALGLGHIRILFRHVLPNAMTPIIVNATLRIGGIILLEAALSYLNLGVQQPTASWGNIIFEGKDFLATAWWITTLPGIAIVITVVSFNLVGDGLRDTFDPRLKNSESPA